ncbi:DUF2608 domain-containing protein [Rickettsia helvetica]|uniref:DUF2608 domain-containing protein n=1 Tax=Rickettsia helvetica TaxID=35789 RepID=A0ABM9NCC0_RICHE|nr:DUF2608 domain-containing protein [Rickettsia helvetica]MCZ6884452.1 DUF2608 domain-containing protein [Rickettsia endosymbiont of Ixodes ricinus]MCZ6896402.1 DUF2608 domain-containing protein [Rickettsia endosymbiont of Ixodes ricinus]
MYSKINKVHDFKEVIETVKQADNTSLVLFDIDEVIVMDSDESRLTHDYRKALMKDIEKRLTRKECELLLSVILKGKKSRFVNLDILKIFALLKEKNIPAMGLTKLPTDKFGVIEDMIEWRIRELAELKVNFQEFSPLEDEIIIEDFNIGYGKPTLKDGIIYTAEYDKGSVLEYVLRKTNYYPQSIIFIDDIEENLLSLQKTCKELKINYQGFEFMGSAIVPEPDLDEQLEKIRFEILEKEYKWLTDTELKTLKK